MKKRLKIAMAAAEMLYSGWGGGGEEAVLREEQKVKTGRGTKGKCDHDGWRGDGG